MQKQVAFLTLIFVVLAAGVYWGWLQNNEKISTQAELAPLISLSKGKIAALEDEQGMVDQINRIEILQHNVTLLNASSEKGVWSAYPVAGQGGFPVVQSSLTALVRALLDAQIVEQKSAEAKHHARLGLLPVMDPESSAYLIRLYTASGSIELLVGNQATVQNGQFVRFAKKDQMLLIDKTLSLPRNPFAWLVKDILPLTMGDVLAIERLSKDGWRIERTPQMETSKTDNEVNQLPFAQENFTLARLSNNQKLAFPTVTSNYVSNLLGLKFEAVQAFDQKAWDAADAILRLEVTTSDISSAAKQSHTIEIAKQNDQFWMKITSSGRLINLNNWLFTISQQQANLLLKTKSDFLQGTR